MEILSIGEKIRRARLTKGMTLKKLCGDEISVSKMSTIENDKVQPEEWVLTIIAERLDIPKSDLMKDVGEEVAEELSRLSEDFSLRNFESDIRELIRITEENALIRLTFHARVTLIDYFIAKNRMDDLNLEISHLYRTFINTVDSETMAYYFLTMGKYMLHTGDYQNAAVFLQNLMENYEELPEAMGEEERLTIPYMLMQCLVFQEKHDAAKAFIPHVERLMASTENQRVKGQIHFLLYLLRTHEHPEGDPEDYDKMTKYLKDYPESHAKSKYLIAIHKAELGDVAGADREIEEAAKLFPGDKSYDNIELLLDALARLVALGSYDTASKYVDVVVNSAIESNRSEAMEEAYYYKGLLLEKKGNYTMAETYMSVSLDLLTKKGKSRKLAKRYRDLANIYYKMDRKDDAIRYFAMALNSDDVMEG